MGFGNPRKIAEVCLRSSTLEYQENRIIRILLLEEIQKAVDLGMAGKVRANYGKREELERCRYFPNGFRLGWNYCTSK